MSCATPLHAYRPTNGGPVSFTRPQKSTYEEIQLPCGQCILCRLEYARQWAVRITHEAQLHAENCFATLTYRNEDIRTNTYGAQTLQYDDLQKFWKRLRKSVGPLRYYATGEYGDITGRPHYHACIFGHAFTAGRTIVRTSPTLLWESPLLTECWGLGGVRIGALTFESAQYTTSYVTKKLSNKRQYVCVDETTGELIPLTQPRAFMSLRPAIGREWLEKYGTAVYDWDHVVIGGRPQKPPKYYDRWLKARSEEALQKIKERRKEKTEKQTEEQAHARAENARARARQKTGSI